MRTLINRIVSWLKYVLFFIGGIVEIAAVFLIIIPLELGAFLFITIPGSIIARIKHKNRKQG